MPKAKTPAKREIPEFAKPFIPALNDYIPRVISPGWTDERFFDFAWRSNRFDGYCANSGVLQNVDSAPCGVDVHEGECVFTRHNKINIALTGPTGTGKTSGLVNFAARHQLPVFTITPMTSAHAAFGQYVPDPDSGGLRWVKGPAWMIAEYGGILYFDEVNFLEPAVLSVFYALTDFRRSLILMEHPIKAVCDTHGMLESLDDDILGIDHRQCPGIRRWQGPLSIPLHPDTLVTASYNPVGSYAGTNVLNAAFSNRFYTIQYDYDTTIEHQLLHCESIALLGEALRLVPDQVRTPVSTNRLIEFERLISETEEYDLAKRLFLGNFPTHEQQAVRRILEDHFEDAPKNSDGGIFKFFGLKSNEADVLIEDEDEEEDWES